MTYYCIMVLTGEEKKFKERAQEAFKDSFPEAQFYFFECDRYTKRRGWFKGMLFPGYLFFGVEDLTSEFLGILRSIKGFCRILCDNQNPVKISGLALDELRHLISYGEVMGVSQFEFVEGEPIHVKSGPLANYDWKILHVNRKKGEVTVQTSLIESGMKFTLKFTEVEPVKD